MFLLCIFFYISFLINIKIFNEKCRICYYKESLIVLIPCFIYLFQLFLKPPILNLLEEPSFWLLQAYLYISF